jgi:uncharacterized protein YqgQ
MFLFRGNKEVPAATSKVKATPAEIHAELVALHKHKTANNQKYIRAHRDLEELRNNLTGNAIDEIAGHLENNEENYALCRQEIRKLLSTNMQQTHNYASWHMTVREASNVSLGKIHKLCISLMPEAFLDVLFMMRARPLSKVIRIKNEINPDTGEVTQSRTVTITPRILQKIDFYLKSVDEDIKKILGKDQRLQTLQEEVEIQKIFSRMEVEKYPESLQPLISQAKTLYNDFLCDNLDQTQYKEFKQLVVNVYQLLDKKLEITLTKFITHMEKMQELLEYGRGLTEKQNAPTPSREMK